MNEELQKKYLEYQLLEQHLKQLQQQLELFHQQITELTRLDEAIDELSKVKDKTKIFCPLGGGIFIEAEISNKNRVLVNIGANTAAFKSFEEAKKSIESQINEVKEIITRFESELGEMVSKYQELQQEIISMQEK